MASSWTASRLVGPSSVSSGTSTVFTGTTAHVYTVRSVIFANPGTVAVTVRIGVGGVTDALTVMAPVQVPGGETFIFKPEMLVLSGTETLQVNATATGLTITVNGVDAT